MYKEAFTFLHFHTIINPDETATNTKSLRAVTFKEKCVPKESGRLTTALTETKDMEICYSEHYQSIHSFHKKFFLKVHELISQHNFINIKTK